MEYSETPFEVKMVPTINPLEVTIRETKSRQPFVPVKTIIEKKMPTIEIGFTSSGFSPLVSNFMVLS